MYVATRCARWSGVLEQSLSIRVLLDGDEHCKPRVRQYDSRGAAWLAAAWWCEIGCLPPPHCTADAQGGVRVAAGRCLMLAVERRGSRRD